MFYLSLYQTFLTFFLSTSGSSDNLEETNEFDTPRSPPMADRQNQRANTTMHVCWHRNTSVSMRDHSLAVKVSEKRHWFGAFWKRKELPQVLF